MSNTISGGADGANIDAFDLDGRPELGEAAADGGPLDDVQTWYGDGVSTWRNSENDFGMEFDNGMGLRQDADGDTFLFLPGGDVYSNTTNELSGEALSGYTSRGETGYATESGGTNAERVDEGPVAELANPDFRRGLTETEAKAPASDEGADPAPAGSTPEGVTPVGDSMWTNTDGDVGFVDADGNSQRIDADGDSFLWNADGSVTWSTVEGEVGTTTAGGATRWSDGEGGGGGSGTPLASPVPELLDPGFRAGASEADALETAPTVGGGLPVDPGNATEESELDAESGGTTDGPELLGSTRDENGHLAAVYSDGSTIRQVAADHGTGLEVEFSLPDGTTGRAGANGSASYSSPDGSAGGGGGGSDFVSLPSDISLSFRDAIIEAALETGEDAPGV